VLAVVEYVMGDTNGSVADLVMGNLPPFFCFAHKPFSHKVARVAFAFLWILSLGRKLKRKGKLNDDLWAVVPAWEGSAFFRVYNFSDAIPPSD
jgi:hypothetical protein